MTATATGITATRTRSSTEHPRSWGRGCFVFAMDRIWQWAWDRYGPRYSWAFYAITFALMLPTYLVWSLFVVAFENSCRYVVATAISIVAVVMLAYILVLPGGRLFHFAWRWSADDEIDNAKALGATYSWARAAIVRGLVSNAACGAVLLVIVGAIAGANGSRLARLTRPRPSGRK